jgi:hypothetical protein
VREEVSKAVHTRQDSRASLSRGGGAIFNTKIAGDGNRAVLELLRDEPAHVEPDQ